MCDFMSVGCWVMIQQSIAEQCILCSNYGFAYILFILQVVTVNHKMLMKVAAVVNLTLMFVLWV